MLLRCGVVVVAVVGCSTSPSPAPAVAPPVVPGPAPAPPSAARTVVELTSGDRHVCVRRADKSVWCWGRGAEGQLGVKVLARAEPADVPALTAASAVAAGGNRTCAIFDGEVRCFEGPRGLVALPAFAGARVTALAVGLRFTCGALDSGRVRCAERDAKPTEITLPDVVELGASIQGPCARTRDGNVACWGNAPAPQVIVQGAVSYAAGWNFRCAALAAGTVRCWGLNTDGQLGVDGPHSEKPVEVRGISDAVQVAAGVRGACARHRTGEVSCWGDLVTDNAAPAKVPGVTDAVALVVGDAHACALGRGGAVTCWGDDSDGQRGHAPFGERTRREAVPGLTGAVTLAPGKFGWCAIDRAADVWCWGRSPFDGGYDGALVDRPTKVPELAGARDLDLGYDTSCVVRADRTLACWGTNRQGGVGDGTTQPRKTPVEVMKGVDEVGAGYAHTCARTGGRVHCWGNNGSGQLGDGTEKDRARPQPIAGIDDATGVTVYSNSTCITRKRGTTCFGAREGRDVTDAVVVRGASDPAACKLLASGTVKCTGYNGHGELGDGTLDYHFKDWVEAKGLADVVSLSTKLTRACAVTKDGAVWCWGNVADTYGLAAPRANDCNLGDGPPEPCVRAPTRVPEIAGAAQVWLGDMSICALVRDGTARCWGRFSEIGWGGAAPFAAAVVALPP